MSERIRFADFHMDRLNPQLAEILDNPELGHARDRAKQISKGGLQKVDLLFGSVYRRANAEIKSAAKSGDPEVLGRLQKDNERLIEYYRTTKDFRVIEKPEDLVLEETYDANNVVLHLEGADFVTSPEIVDDLYNRGVRSVGPLYSHDNLLGGGAAGAKNRGLTALGKRVVDRMVERGMIVDISHANRKTAHDILERVRGYEKAVATHTALGSRQRNITVSLLRKIAERGGVVGFTPAKVFFPTFEKFMDAYKRASDSTGSVEHLAVGTDFGGLSAEQVFSEFDEIGKLSALAEQLSERGGFKDEDIAKIMYGNVARVVKKLK